MATRTFMTDRGDDGRRIDLVLRRHLSGVDAATRTRIQRWIEDGAVTVNGGRVRRTASRIAPGDLIAIALPRAAEATRPPCRRRAADLDLLLKTITCSRSTSPRGWSCTPRTRTRPGR